MVPMAPIPAPTLRANGGPRLLQQSPRVVVRELLDSVVFPGALGALGPGAYPGLISRAGPWRLGDLESAAMDDGIGGPLCHQAPVAVGGGDIWSCMRGTSPPGLLVP